jgi:hypothetical protein
MLRALFGKERLVTAGAIEAVTASRPTSIKEAAVFGAEHGQRDAYLREFLDEFYCADDDDRRAAMLRDEPPLVDGDRANAYYAAVAEHLAFEYHLPVPPWTSAPSRFLTRPFFPSGLESLKATLLRDSPVAFRRRMIFVDANPLYRPRKDVPRFGM